MTNQTTSRLLLRDPTRPSFGKARLFAGLLAVLTVLAPFQIPAQESGLNEPTKRLFQAVHDNNLPAVQVSITDGANIEAADESGLTPVDIAVDEGFFDIAHFLLSVRNARGSRPGGGPGQATDWTPTVRTPETAPVPPAPVAPVAEKLSEAAAGPASPPIPAWPIGKPNPFDPDAAGATLPVLGEVQGGATPEIPPPPEAVAAAPPPEPKPAPEPETAEETSKTLKEVAEIPPPPSEDRQVTGASPAVSERPGDGAQDDAGPSSIERLMDKISDALKEKQEARTGEARTGSTQQEARTGEARTGSAQQEARTGETRTGSAQQEARTGEARTGSAQQEARTGEARTGSAQQEARTGEARIPSTTGARAGNVETEPPFSFIEKISDFFLGLFGDTSTRPPPETPEGPKPIEDDGGKWVVRDVETAAKEPARKSGRSDAGNAPRQTAITEGKAPTASLSRYLTGITLTLGRSVRLGVPPFAQGGAQSKPCIEKKNGALAFCIEDVDWPNWIEPYFQVNSIMYRGAKAIARYDEGVATSYHVIFPTGSYPAVVQYYTRKFGKPTKTLNRSIAPLAAPRRENPTAIWQSVDTITKQITTLEIREFDDARGSFPDTRRGAVMLYQQWSSPIFPYLSTLELMNLNAQVRAQG